MHKLKTHYRADIDGLRAIAILFVLFFHAGLKPFVSGFIGVDIFFVISGFLITGIIHTALQENNFSFFAFYKSRLWRLQPVLICLMICTFLMCLWFYLPEDLLHFAKSLRKTVLFSSNNYFARETTAYFAEDNHILPLLHTWSLSVEWQCYFILPFFIYAIYSLVDETHLPKIFYACTCLFLGITLYESSINSGVTYYRLSSRIFEFLIGSCVFLNQYKYKLNKHILNLFSGFALVLLFYLAMSPHIIQGFPNFYALILCCATGILLFVGSQEAKSAITQVLAIKPLVFIGLISYSLYIWHWPILVLMRYFNIKETLGVLTGALSFIFLLAYISWRFIEKPLRLFKKISFTKSLVYLFLIPLIIVYLGDGLIKHYEGYPGRFIETVRINRELKEYSNPLRANCLHDKFAQLDPHCVLGSQELSSKKGFLFGDSHANHYWGFINTLAQKAKLSLVTDTISACLALPGINLLDWNKQQYTACKLQTEYYYKLIATNHYDFVILSQNWEGYLSDKIIPQRIGDYPQQLIEKSLDKALEQIVTSGAKPVLIKAIAPGNAYHCFFKHIKLRQTYKPKSCDFEMSAQNYQWQNDLFMRMKKKYKTLIIIDPKKEQCPKGRCLASIQNLPLFRDEGHLNDYASFYLGRSYLEHHKNPLG